MRHIMGFPPMQDKRAKTHLNESWPALQGPFQEPQKPRSPASKWI